MLQSFLQDDLFWNRVQRFAHEKQSATDNLFIAKSLLLQNEQRQGQYGLQTLESRRQKFGRRRLPGKNGCCLRLGDRTQVVSEFVTQVQQVNQAGVGFSPFFIFLDESWRERCLQRVFRIIPGNQLGEAEKVSKAQIACEVFEALGRRRRGILPRAERTQRDGS